MIFRMASGFSDVPYFFHSFDPLVNNSSLNLVMIHLLIGRMFRSLDVECSSVEIANI